MTDEREALQRPCFQPDGQPKPGADPADAEQVAVAGP